MQETTVCQTRSASKRVCTICTSVAINRTTMRRCTQQCKSDVEKIDTVTVRWNKSEIKKFKSDNHLNNTIRHKQLAQKLKKLDFMGMFRHIPLRHIQNMLYRMSQNRTQNEFVYTYQRERHGGSVCPAVRRYQYHSLQKGLEAYNNSNRQQMYIVNLKKKLKVANSEIQSFQQRIDVLRQSHAKELHSER